jgi:RND family efflux transporter MFP subunit
VGLALTVQGCGEPVRSETVASPATDVMVSQPTVEEVTDYEEFTGHTDAIKSVTIMSRATGYLISKHFKDGDDVKEGDLLYEIDDRTYRAALEGAQSSLLQAEAHFNRLDADFRRAKNLFQGANIGKQEFDLTSSNYAEAKAAVGVAKASLETASQNISYTKIHAPMSGTISRTLVDPGNLIRQEVTILNDIVKTDELYVYFDLNEQGMQRVSELIQQGRVGQKNGEHYGVEVGTSVDQDNYDNALGHYNDLKAILKRQKVKDPKLVEQLKAAKAMIPDEFPFKGEVNFSENTLDAATGTLRVRGIIKNPPPYFLTPGLFVRVRLPYGSPHPVTLIPEEAIASDQGRGYVYVVDPNENEVVYRPVVTGPDFNNLRSIREGLKPEEQIIIDPDAIRRVRPGAKVNPIRDSE